MNGEEPQTLKPWYKHYNGSININPRNASKYINLGEAHALDNYNVEITELPIKKSTSEYKKFLDKLVEKGVLDDIREYH